MSRVSELDRPPLERPLTVINSESTLIDKIADMVGAEDADYGIVLLAIPEGDRRVLGYKGLGDYTASDLLALVTLALHEIANEMEGEL